MKKLKALLAIVGQVLGPTKTLQKRECLDGNIEGLHVPTDSGGGLIAVVAYQTSVDNCII
jgi:hypothetical protein